MWNVVNHVRGRLIRKTSLGSCNSQLRYPGLNAVCQETLDSLEILHHSSIFVALMIYDIQSLT